MNVIGETNVADRYVNIFPVSSKICQLDCFPWWTPRLSVPSNGQLYCLGSDSLLVVRVPLYTPVAMCKEMLAH